MGAEGLLRHGTTVTCEKESESPSRAVAGVGDLGRWMALRDTIHSVSPRASSARPRAPRGTQEAGLGRRRTYLQRLRLV